MKGTGNGVRKGSAPIVCMDSNFFVSMFSVISLQTQYIHQWRVNRQGCLEDLCICIVHWPKGLALFPGRTEKLSYEQLASFSHRGKQESECFSHHRVKTGTEKQGGRAERERGCERGARSGGDLYNDWSRKHQRRE